MRTGALVSSCLVVVLAGACSDGHGSSSASQSASSESVACGYFNEREVTSLFGTRPQREVDPLGIGGSTSNCLWKANTGGSQYFLHVAVYDGTQHYAQSDRSNAKDLSGLGDEAFIDEGTLGGVNVEFVRANKTYFVLFSIAQTSGATRNDANPKAGELLALMRKNLSRLS